MEPGESSRKKTRRGGSRRGKKTRMPTIPEGHLVDIPVIPEGQPQPAAPHHAPAAGPIPTLDYGFTTADPAASWALFQTFAIQHEGISDLRELAGLPRLPGLPYRLGRGPGAAPPPWAFFPAPPAAGTADAPIVIPEHSESSFSDHSAMLAESSRASTSSSSSSSDDSLSALMAAAAAAGFDPEEDDLLDDF